MGPTVQIFGETDAFAVGIREKIVFLICKERPSIEGTDVLRTAFRMARTIDKKNKFGFYILISEKSSKLNPPVEVRDAMSQIIKENERNLAGAAIVFEGKGFYATFVRSVVLGIYMVSRAQFPMNITPTVTSASAWLSIRMSGDGKGGLSPDEISRTVIYLSGPHETRGSMHGITVAG